MVTALCLLTTHNRPASSRLQVGDVQDNYITYLKWSTLTTISAYLKSTTTQQFPFEKCLLHHLHTEMFIYCYFDVMR